MTNQIKLQKNINCRAKQQTQTKMKHTEPGKVAYAYNSSTWEATAGRSQL